MNKELANLLMMIDLMTIIWITSVTTVAYYRSGKSLLASVVKAIGWMLFLMLVTVVIGFSYGFVTGLIGIADGVIFVSALVLHYMVALPAWIVFTLKKFERTNAIVL